MAHLLLLIQPIEPELIFLLVYGLALVGYLFLIKLTKQEVWRFVMGVVLTVVGLLLLIKLTKEEEVAVGFAFTIFGMLLLIQLTRKEVWRFAVGVPSTMVGLLCYALSSSFNNLFGEWNALKIILYIVFSFILLLLVQFAKAWQHLSLLQHRARMTFLVWVPTTVFSFFVDRAAKGKPDAYSLVSYAAFAMMSFSCGFAEFLYFFSAVLTTQLMKTELMLGSVGIGFSYFLIVPDSVTCDPPKRLVIQPAKQKAWRLVVVGSTVVGMLCYALSSSFNQLFGEWNSLKIFLDIALISIISLRIFFRMTGKHFSIIQFKGHITLLVLTLTLMGACFSFFPNKAAVRPKPDAYIVVAFAAFFVSLHGFVKPTLNGLVVLFIYMLLPIVLLMNIKLWLGFVGVGVSFLPFVLHSYLDAAPEHLGIHEQPQVVIEESSPQSGEDQPQAVTEVDTPQSREDQLQVVIEVASPQSSEDQPEAVMEEASPQPSEDQPQAVTEEASPQSREDQLQVVIEVASPQSGEDQPEAVMEEASPQSNEDQPQAVIEVALPQSGEYQPQAVTEDASLQSSASSVSA